MKYIFCDTKLEVASYFQKVFGKENDAIVYSGDFTDLIEYSPDGLIIVCPINSLGEMSSGFSLLCKQVFPDAEDQIRELIEKYGISSGKSRHFLEIGSAVITSTYKIIAVPTMYTNQVVKNTENAFYAFLAAKNLAQKINTQHPYAIRTLVCPGLCTGTGGMLPKISVDQIHKAYKSIHNRDERPKISQIYYNSICSMNQPPSQENREFINAYRSRSNRSGSR